ncbi:18598_t:CDS:2 [Gigaspora rosea]|nr:18598_t:CDS:2 [Gigaspora rosea]
MTTLPAHVLEGRNLTMSPANISGHKFEKRHPYKFDPLNFNKKKKGKIIIQLPNWLCTFNRNIVIDEPWQFQPLLLSRVKFFLYRFFGYRFTPYVTSSSQDSPLLNSTNPLLANLQGKPSYMPYCSNPNFLSMILKDLVEEQGLCLPRHIEDIIRPADSSTSLSTFCLAK